MKLLKTYLLACLLGLSAGLAYMLTVSIYLSP